MKNFFEKIRQWWNRKMLDRAVAKAGLRRCYSPFDIGYQPEGEKLDNLPTPPKGGTSQNQQEGPVHIFCGCQEGVYFLKGKKL